MSTNKTQHYHLNQWEAEDAVLRTEFNEDNQKIDGALSALSAGLEGAATVEQLTALSGRNFAPPSPKLSPGPIRGMERPARPSPWALLPRRS